MRSVPPLLAVFLAASGCTRGGDSEEVCHEAAELCGAGDEFDEDDCRGEQKAYAECIVDRGDCDPATLVECADGSAGGGDGGPGGGGGAIELSITTFTDSGVGLLDVAFAITNVGESEPIPVAATYFQIEDEAANLHVASGGICFGGELLATGGSEDCELQFSIGAAAPVALVYRDGLGRDAEASLEGICSGGPEASEAACSDGCSNDDDSYIDCDDYDCCDVVACGPGTSCGDM